MVDRTVIQEGARQWENASLHVLPLEKSALRKNRKVREIIPHALKALEVARN